MRKYIVTGGAGFIGCNTARRLLGMGERVVVVDNLSRRGAARNIEWLRGFGAFDLIECDVRDAAAVEGVFRAHADASVVIHLAGQVAVTKSIENPRDDFEQNALGALNVLEAVRQSGARPFLIYASTNKVYGGMELAAIEERPTRYVYRDYPLGIPETFTLDFHSPYGCSKGAADQYWRDYARIYDLSTVVYRQSCIYGPRQFGVEDQGWLAWFVIAAALGRPVSIYGDGKQVRDVLYIDDLIDAYLLAVENQDKTAGQIFNVGGGPEFTMSVWAEFGPILERLLGRPIPAQYGPWRPGDQPVYVSDTTKIRDTLGWRPKVSIEEGARHLFEWVMGNRELFE